MKVTIAINNFNYGNFIIECVESVLNQTYRNIEILVIDDGSTDNSLTLLNDHYKDTDIVKIISKKNGGQLSAFNEILKYATGELLFFLDADDLYKENYIQEVSSIYTANNDIGFIFCAYEKIFNDGRHELIKTYPSNRTIGFSLLSSFYDREWAGGVTSTVSMKTSVFKSFMPIDFEKDWVTRADDCLIWGSSIAGVKKYFVAESFILYRVHESNLFHGKIFSNDYLYNREISINKLFKYFIDKSKIDINRLNLFELEYKSRCNYNVSMLRRYFKILLRMRINLPLKMYKLLWLLLVYLKCNIQSPRG